MSQFVLTFNTPWRNGSGNPIHKYLHCQLNKLHLLFLITGRSAPRPPHVKWFSSVQLLLIPAARTGVGELSPLRKTRQNLFGFLGIFSSFEGTFKWCAFIKARIISARPGGGHTLFTDVLATSFHDLISVSLRSTATAAVPVLKSVFSDLGLP